MNKLEYKRKNEQWLEEKANVEKVVNPPQKPVFKNKTSAGEICPPAFCAAPAASAAIAPTIKQPRIFVKNVWNGKTAFTGTSKIK